MMQHKQWICPDKLKKQYDSYIRSSRWKNIRQSVFKMRGKKCEICGTVSVPLEIHHTTYERLGKESPKDLLIVCHECHKKEDQKRATSNAIKKESNRLDRAFETWCDKRDREPDEIEWDHFNRWLECQSLTGGL